MVSDVSNTSPSAVSGPALTSTVHAVSKPSSGHISSGPITFSHLITIKLAPDNYLFWRAQIVSLLKSHLLLGYVDGTFQCPSATLSVTNEDGITNDSHNPAYSAWIQQDQAILSAILASSTMEVASIIMFANTSHDAWSTLAGSYASQSSSRSMQIRTQLGAMKKLDASITTYFNKIKALSDTLTSIGQPLRPEEFMSYFLMALMKSMIPLWNQSLVATHPFRSKISMHAYSLRSKESKADERLNLQPTLIPHNLLEEAAVTIDLHL